MNLSPLIDELRRDEGVIPHAYQDSLGYWTIGVGHLIDKRKGGKMPDVIIDMLLRYDIDEKIAELNEKLPWWGFLDEPSQRVIVNMAFNLGVEGLLKFGKFMDALKDGDRNRAASEMLDSKWAEQVGARATRLATIIRGT